MKKLTSLFVIIVSLLFSIKLNAYESGVEKPLDAEIKGVIIDNETGGPLEYATISLFHSQDSTLVTGVISDMDGAFSIKTLPGKYYIVIQFMGYETKTINLDIKNARDVVALGKITMYPDSALLDEATILLHIHV